MAHTRACLTGSGSKRPVDPARSTPIRFVAQGNRGTTRRDLRMRPQPGRDLRRSLYNVFVGSVHICPQARQLNHWIVPAASPTSRSLLPQLLQRCCEGRRYAGSRADVLAGIRRSEELCAFGIAFSGRFALDEEPTVSGGLSRGAVESTETPRRLNIGESPEGSSSGHPTKLRRNAAKNR